MKTAYCIIIKSRMNRFRECKHLKISYKSVGSISNSNYIEFNCPWKNNTIYASLVNATMCL